MREETRCIHEYSFRLAARDILYAPSHREDSTYHGLCYTSRGALAGTGNSSMKDDPSCSFIDIEDMTQIKITKNGHVSHSNITAQRQAQKTHHVLS